MIRGWLFTRSTDGSANGAPGRRRWQFSLGFLLMVVAGIAVVMAVLKSRAGESQALINLRQEKVKFAQKWVTSRGFNFGDPGPTYTEIQRAERALLDAQLEAALDKRQRLKALHTYRDKMDLMYRKIAALYQAGARGGEPELHAEAKYHLLEAEIWILEQEAKP